MATIWNGWYWHLGLASFIAMSGAIATAGNCVLAQITPDGTLGAEGSVVTPTNINGLPGNQIDGGAARGANLFHSFEQFSIPTGSAAYFNNALDIQNIISRVTGGSISNIDGLLRANGTANLFLINPNGIIFGPNARLNIGGSFIGSTAYSLRLSDGSLFSATNPQAPPLLTINVPIGLQLGPNPGNIGNQSVATNSSGEVVGLSVPPGQTLSLIGGNVSLNGGHLTSPGGRVELGALAQGNVRLGTDFSLSFPESESGTGVEPVRIADIFLTNGAAVNVAFGSGGSIAINTRNLEISGESQLQGGIVSKLSLPGTFAGNVDINATGAITLSNASLIHNEVFEEAVGNSGNINITADALNVTDRSAISTNTFGFGNSGNININVKSLSATSGSNIAASTFGRGNGGEITLNAAESATFDGVGSNGLSTASGSSVNAASAVGNGSSLTINTRNLTVTNGAQLTGATFGRGNGGSVTINANSIKADGVGSHGYSTGLGSTVGTDAVGNGGNLTINTNSLTVTGGAQLTTGNNSNGQGGAGNIAIQASGAVVLDGVGSNEKFSGVLTSIYSASAGQGGNVTMTADTLTLSNGAQISSSTQGQGNAGNIDINTRTLQLNNGAINASTLSNGQGGNITISAEESVNLTDGVFLISYEQRKAVNSQIPISISAASFASGRAGNITLNTRQLRLQDKAFLGVSSFATGDAGSLRVNASDIRLDNQSLINGFAQSGQGGNINLQVQNSLVLRELSSITTEARGTGNGGNITIDTDTLVALENSDIIANAEQSFGGQVSINAQGIFGTEFRDTPTLESDITATGGRPELSGTVEINNPDVDLSQGLVSLPAEVLDASNSFAPGCTAGGENKFIITGRGGLPPNPRQVLSSNAVQVDWVELSADALNLARGVESRVARRRGSSPPQAYNTVDVNHPVTEIVEAQGWIVDANGNVTLVATAPTANIDIPWLPSSSCNAPEPKS